MRDVENDDADRAPRTSPGSSRTLRQLGRLGHPRDARSPPDGAVAPRPGYSGGRAQLRGATAEWQRRVGPAKRFYLPVSTVRLPVRVIAFICRPPRAGRSRWPRSSRHDPAGRWRRRANRTSCQPTSILWWPASRRGCNLRHYVADLLDPPPGQLRAWRDAPFAEGRGGSPIRRQALAAVAAPAQREEARRQLGRPLAHPGSRPATGWTARQTWSRVLDSRRRRPSRPSSVPRDCWPGPRARARSSDTARTTPPRNQPRRARTRSSQPRTWRCPRRRPKADWTCSAGIAALPGRSGRPGCAHCRSGS